MSALLVDIETAAGVVQGTIEAIDWTNTRELSRAGKFSFTMPITSEKKSLILPKRIARCYRVVNGSRVEVGAGLIDEDSYAIKAGERGPVLQVGGDDLLRELTHSSVGFLDLTDGSGGGVPDALAQVITFASGWSFDTVNGYGATTNDVYAQFKGESVLQALVKIAEKTGENFRLGAGRKVIWMRAANADSGIEAIQGGEPIELEGNPHVAIIEEMAVSRKSYDLVTKVYPYGAGQGDARLTLKSTTKSAPADYTLNASSNYISSDDGITDYGTIERYISFKDVGPVSNTGADIQSAADVLFDAALDYLQQHDTPQTEYGLTLAKVDQLLYPGETVKVTYRERDNLLSAIDIDTDLYIISVAHKITAEREQLGELTVSTISRRIPGDAEIVSENIGTSQIFESHPQLSANSYTTGYSFPMDDSKDGSVHFWLGAEVTNINEVVFRFRIDPLRSTVKTVAGTSTTTNSGGGSTSGSGGSSTPTSSSGGSSTPTTASGGSSTPTTEANAGANTESIGLHSHQLTDHLASGANYTETVPSHFHYLNPHTHTVTIDGHTHTVTIDPHTHTVTISDHTHSTPDHTHTLTPNLETTYGIFEESAGNTLAESNLVYSVNGGADVGGDVVDEGGGWFSLDITDELISPTTLRPTQEANTLVISTATAKTCQITGQLSVRNVIQAIANL